MLRVAILYCCFFGLAVVFADGKAVAQSTSNCFAIGANMVHCDTMGMGSAGMGSLGMQSSNPPHIPYKNCNDVEYTPTIPGDPYAGESKGRRILGAISDALIVGGGGCPEHLRQIMREKIAKFRVQVGKLLADGDCRGASRMAFENGQLELGQSISASCSPNVSPTAEPTPDLNPTVIEGVLRQIAIRAKVPMDVGHETTIVKVDAKVTQLIFRANITGVNKDVRFDQYNNVLTQVCDLDPEFLGSGATAKVSFYGNGNDNIGNMLITRRECKF